MDRVVIDAHLHLWNTERLRYEWLQQPGNAAINRTFGFKDFRARAAGTIVAATSYSWRGRLRPGNLLCRRGLPDLFFPPVWSRVL